MKLDTSSLAHTQWECKYHIVFAPKYRRQIIYGKIRQDIGMMLRKLCEYKGIEIIEAEACKDHIHMLLSIPPKFSVSQIMGYLKGKSSLMIFEKYANLKYKYGNRHFWCRGYYVSTVGRNKRVIEQYIRNQLQEDYAEEHNINISEINDGYIPLGPNIEGVGTICKAFVSNYSNRDWLSANLIMNDGRIITLYLDFSVKAEPGDILDVNTLRYRSGINRYGKEYYVLKGRLL